MKPDRTTALYGIISLSLLASLIVCTQILFILAKGDIVCLNEGCRVVESQTIISPFYFNLLGLFYFQVVFWLSLINRKKPQKYLLPLILLAGIAVEGILIGFQTFVVHTYCSYCLLIFLFVVILNGLADLRQLGIGLAMVIVQMGAFSLLRFNAPENLLEGFTLDKGTYAIRECSDANKQHLYLLFSENCPHCHNVLKTLEQCTRCEFHFNPIEHITSEILPGIIPNKTYTPLINSMTLKIFGIDTVPVLIAMKSNGLIFIKGESSILSYIENNCFHKTILDDYLSDPIPSWEEECTIDELCK